MQRYVCTDNAQKGAITCVSNLRARRSTLQMRRVRQIKRMNVEKCRYLERRKKSSKAEDVSILNLLCRYKCYLDVFIIVSKCKCENSQVLQ